MKLRIAKDSLRFRVLRSELVALQAGQVLQESIRLAPGPQGLLTYALGVVPQSQPVQVAFEACAIRVHLSKQQFSQWAREDQVGVYDQIDFEDEGFLSLILEKDFACLDATAEENRDTFDHPEVGATC